MCVVWLNHLGAHEFRPKVVRCKMGDSLGLWATAEWSLECPVVSLSEPLLLHTAYRKQIFFGDCSSCLGIIITVVDVTDTCDAKCVPVYISVAFLVVGGVMVVIVRVCNAGGWSHRRTQSGMGRCTDS